MHRKLCTVKRDLIARYYIRMRRLFHRFSLVFIFLQFVLLILDFERRQADQNKSFLFGSTHFVLDIKVCARREIHSHKGNSKSLQNDHSFDMLRVLKCIHFLCTEMQNSFSDSIESCLANFAIRTCKTYLLSFARTLVRFKPATLFCKVNALVGTTSSFFSL